MFKIALLNFCVAMSPTVGLASGCEGFLAQAEVISGVTPRFNDDGSLRSILSFATADFLAPKPSLISAARTIAEMSAKKNFAAWMEESIVATTSASSVSTRSKNVDAAGNSKSQAAISSTLAETYLANSNAVLNGMVKVDECIDPDAKMMYVAMGWKPKVVAASTQLDVEPETAELTLEPAPPATLIETPVSKSGITIVTIEVKGFGGDQTMAINDGLRLAVSQVYGEKFVAAMGASSVVLTAEEINAAGDSDTVALVGQSIQTSATSETNGIISGFRILDISGQNGQLHVKLSVDIPKFKPLDLGTAQKIIILPPKVLSGDKNEFYQYLPDLQHEAETMLTKANGLVVLNRENVPQLDNELGAFSDTSTYKIEELAKLGNRVGADLVLITELGYFQIDRKNHKMAGKNVGTWRLSGDLWVKVVDVATSATIFALRIPIEGGGLADGLNLNQKAIMLGNRVAQSVGEAIGNGFPEDVTTEIKARIAAVPKVDIKETSKKIKAAKDDIADQW